ncbi:MAG: tetratricopeptide repeat protein [Ardenticatenaceae bacterium]
MSNGARLLSFLRAQMAQAWAWLAYCYQHFSAAVRAPQYDSIWEGVALVGLLPLLYYVLRLWYHGWGYDPDFLNFTAGVATLVALVSLLGFQSEWGQLLARRVNLMVNLSRLWQNSKRVCLTVWVTVGLLWIAFHWGYPWWAYRCNLRGADALEEGRYSAAVQDFRQAVTLFPDNANGHYNLARAYESLYQYEEAISEYQQALELDDELWPAYNNLGSLYLVARNEPDAALTILLAAQTRTNDAYEEAVLGKNIAWAYLKKGLFHVAGPKLDEVIAKLEEAQAQGHAVSIDFAESYRLMALTYDALAQPEDAKRAWATSQGYALAVRDSERCQPPVRLSEIDCLNAQIWAAEAEQALGRRRGGPP